LEVPFAGLLKFGEFINGEMANVGLGLANALQRSGNVDESEDSEINHSANALFS